VSLYGGFAGTEDPDTFALALRDFAAYQTILDGRIGVEGNVDNVHHVVTSNSTEASAVLDGFTITGGCANGATALLQDVGGGLLNIDGSPTIRHCLFIHNHAGWGGAAYNAGTGQPRLINCRFVGNTASTDGGAIFSRGAVATFTTIHVINGLFSGNESLSGHGGAFFNTLASRATLLNATLAANNAGGQGGGIYHEYGLMTLTNCVLWGNRDRGGVDQSAQLGGGLPTVRYSCIQGLNGALLDYKNIGNDPLFVDPYGTDGVAGTEDDNLRPAPGSPCIDAGTNDAPIDNVRLDLDGRPRVVDDPGTPDTGYPPGAAAIIDMGAYEYREPCNTDTDCDDGDPCTDDNCTGPGGHCVHALVDCDDAVFCNGLETCVDGACQVGTAPNCDDGVACTVDACDATADICTHEPDDADCDNGLYCDGFESCDVLDGCQPGTPVVCDDGIHCTDDTCDETTDGCRNIPIDSVCDDGLYCNGAETCDPVGGVCQSGVWPCEPPLLCDEVADVCVACLDNVSCDDGLFCNGQETCISGTCLEGTAPCGAEDLCDEEADACRPQPLCQNDNDCDDVNPCTDDQCQKGTCVHVNNTAPCDDGNACTEDDRCAAGSCTGAVIPGCGTPPPPPPDIDNDGVDDAADLCPADPDKIEPGVCGCGVPDVDTDDDGTADCHDACPADANKTNVGLCGCAAADEDTDTDGVLDCHDQCPDTPPEVPVDHSGCAVDTTPRQTPPPGSEVDGGDADGDGVPDALDLCPDTPPGQVSDAVGCVVDAQDGSTPAMQSCGACGAFGMITWPLLLAALLSVGAVWRFAIP
jgi:predicted outer membrane repeat protein